MADKKDGRLAELKLGWPILLAAVLGLACYTLEFYTNGLFVGQFQKEFGWTRSQISLAATLATFSLALLAPAAGWIIDRVGVRLPALIAYAWLAFSFYYFSQMKGSLAIYLAIHVFGAVLLVGATPIALTRPVNAAFHKMRGLALGIASGGSGTMALVAPPIVANIIKTGGWRAAFQQMSLLVLVLGTLVIVLLNVRLRSFPSAPCVAEKTSAGPSALRSPVFWRLFVAFGLLSLSVSGFILHLVPILTDRGVSLPAAAKTMSVLGAAVLCGRFGVGLALDRFFAPWVATCTLIVTAAGMCLLAFGGTKFAMVAAFGIGFSFGAEIDLIGYVTARYFGLRGYSRIYGMIYSVFLVGTGLSPLAIAEVQARSGSYDPALLGAAGLLLIASALFAFAPKFPLEGSLNEEPDLHASESPAVAPGLSHPKGAQA